jgi:peptide/nickel transport system ATP-binding protein
VPLLSVEGLDVSLPTPRGPAHVVRGVSFALERCDRLGIVGESGCGKTMTALALIGLLPEGARVGGRILLHGRDLLALPEAELCRLRGDRIAMVFQEPMTALNPVQTVGRQIAEGLRVHRRTGRAEAAAEAARLLERVGIPDARRRLVSYPHQLSGGQRQRVMIAMALACRPDVLVADEPTTALDVTVQARILDLLRDLADEFGMALVLITHDLGVIAEMADRMLVMYAGRVVEEGPTETVFGRPAHPYTRALFAAIPRAGERRRLAAIPGAVPDLARLPDGCAFADRCPHAIDACRAAPPPDLAVGANRTAACIRAREWA